MKLNARRLLALTLCAFVPFLAVAENDRDEDDEDKNVVYGMELPSTKPKSVSLSLEDAKERFEKLFELREKVLDCFSELEEVAKIEDPRRLKRKAEGALRKLERAKKTFFKEAKKVRGKYEKPFKQLSVKKKKLEREIEQAEDKGDDKRATKCAQEIARFGTKYENLESTINDINYYCFFEQDQLLAQALDMDIPGYDRSKNAFNQDDDKDGDEDDKARKKKKKRKQLDEDDDDDDDNRDRKKKRRRRKKSRR